MMEIMRNIVESIEQAKAPAVAEEPKGPEDKEPAQFEFMDSRDKVGLPFEHASYVKRSCKDCNGKGYLTLLIGDGYKPLAAGQTKREAYEKARAPRACFCVNKGYVRVRKQFEQKWKTLLNDPKYAPHSEAEEWASRVALVTRMGFTAPPIPSKTVPAPADV